MKVLITFLRWALGLGVGLVIILLVNIGFPLTILVSQAFDSSVGMKWVNGITSNESGLASFTDNVLTAMGDSANLKDVEDPGAQAVIVAMSNANTQLGKDTRTVLDAKTVGKNLSYNATAFYGWLDGKTQNIKFIIYLGGTTQDKESFLTQVLKVRYDTLPACTNEQLTEISQDPESSYFTVPCQAGVVTESTFASYAHTFLADPELVQYIDGGIAITKEVSPQRRTELLNLKKNADTGLMLNWILVMVCVALMLLLLVPVSVGLIMTGLTLIVSGFVLSGIWTAIFNSLTITGGQSAITSQSILLMGAGFLMIGFGIFLTLRKKPATVEGPEQKTAKVV